MPSFPQQQAEGREVTRRTRRAVTSESRRFGTERRVLLSKSARDRTYGGLLRAQVAGLDQRPPRSMLCVLRVRTGPAPPRKRFPHFFVCNKRQQGGNHARYRLARVGRRAPCWAWHALLYTAVLRRAQTPARLAMSDSAQESSIRSRIARQPCSGKFSRPNSRVGSLVRALGAGQAPRGARWMARTPMEPLRASDWLKGGLGTLAW